MSESERGPLGSYLILAAVYNAVVVAAILAARSANRLPQRPAASDVLLIGMATQRLSRLLAKDRVTSPVRAPFTEPAGEGGPGEVEETARGTGMRRALGELVLCPFCLAQWVATGLWIALLFIPRATRFACAVFSAVAIADFLQFGYRKGQEAIE